MKKQKQLILGVVELCAAMSSLVTVAEAAQENSASVPNKLNICKTADFKKMMSSCMTNKSQVYMCSRLLRNQQYKRCPKNKGTN